MGRWNLVEKPSSWQPTMPYKFLKCSKCGYEYRWWYYNMQDICPKCGDDKREGGIKDDNSKKC